MTPLIRAEALSHSYKTRRFLRPNLSHMALDGIDLSLAAGETLAVVGESGSGKSTLGRMLLGIERPTGGRVSYEGRDLSSFGPAEALRLTQDLQMVFQNPSAALDPRLAVISQIAEPLLIHKLAGLAEARSRAAEMMERVGLPPPLANRTPKLLSGGQRQRVVIARALMTGPRFVVFDEAVSALDVSVQAQILELIRSLRRSGGFASLFITHDLRVVRHVADRVAVLYLGRLVEEGPARQIFAAPGHPYTRALLAAIPGSPLPRAARLHAGEIRREVGLGCALVSRCPVASALCAQLTPPLVRLAPGRRLTCHHPLPRPAPRAQGAEAATAGLVHSVASQEESA
ncbi:ATP-binding cassette domain-containing protein [Xinfangfangia sp. D13-10-4-6]|uniref:oligopeptide/dipeptide ABC transporter ATP-binding protein n=1 Tax=Pseudogemmobacter hezensis TaxID=2737662 RepID=UPI001551F486|nr:oligopeptide/dipeptide ABC transporter ATP-binding protein [Pseudogemmobacter hezensis]NPD17455.1 ATP-binding cassette domain-containing protein [Pseudogemmobacter hezensis]